MSVRCFCQSTRRSPEKFPNLQIKAAVSAIMKREQSGHQSPKILDAQTFRLPVLYIRFDMGQSALRILCRGRSRAL